MGWEDSEVEGDKLNEIEANETQVNEGKEHVNDGMEVEGDKSEVHTVEGIEGNKNTEVHTVEGIELEGEKTVVNTVGAMDIEGHKTAPADFPFDEGEVKGKEEDVEGDNRADEGDHDGNDDANEGDNERDDGADEGDHGGGGDHECTNDANEGDNESGNGGNDAEYDGEYEGDSDYVEHEESKGSVQVGGDCGAKVSLNEDSFTSAGSEDGLEVDRERELKHMTKRKSKEEAGDTFFIGQIFGSREEVNDLVNKHAVETKWNIVFKKIDNDRVRAVCKGIVNVFKGGQDGIVIGPKKSETGPSESSQAHDSQASCNEGEEVVKCPWVLYVPKLKNQEGTWRVTTYCSEHKCTPTRDLTAFNTEFLVKEEWVVSKMESNPKISIKAMQQELQARYQLRVSRIQAHRSKSRATDLLRGNFADQYQRLRDYTLELKSKNPGTTVHIEVEPEQNPDSPTRVFKRIYICLGALKQGFKACKRELLGLDGAFMKGPFPSQMLTLVGLDPNNGIYPLAYAVVEAESKDSWTWFLQCLADDLDLPSNANFTFISDRQKGILPALATVFPSAEHRFCLRHIHQNMKQTWRGKAYKDLIWGAATARTQPWEYLMKRHVSVLQLISKEQGPLTPTSAKMFDERKEKAYNYKELWNGGTKFQVSGPWNDQVVVDVEKLTCTCRKWQLTGLPCKHAITANWEMDLLNQKIKGGAEAWIHPCHWLDTWKEVYSLKINPINGRNMWVKDPCPTTLKPPFHHTPVGRPKKKRRKSQVEIDERSCKGQGGQGAQGEAGRGQRGGGVGKRGRGASDGGPKGRGESVVSEAGPSAAGSGGTGRGSKAVGTRGRGAAGRGGTGRGAAGRGRGFEGGV
ncbi:hypothetical protein SSX86_031684 [Deinandra increscens subsp. villosa]|uniref:SWIM-type domain-containing protein n=1 Tax=Deinandra increscens subsp. villosa TaxID=3103831 RepID=A0AAP0GH77_9ASTR